MVEKVIRNNQVAVLISSYYGAGWSTWNKEYEDICLFHPLFVEAAEKGVKNIKDIIKILTGDEDNVFDGGWDNVEIMWLKKGTAFTINEYDGFERLEIIDDITKIA